MVTVSLLKNLSFFNYRLDLLDLFLYLFMFIFVFLFDLISHYINLLFIHISYYDLWKTMMKTKHLKNVFSILKWILINRCLFIFIFSLSSSYHTKTDVNLIR
jgi:hypothetical protein